MIELMPNVKKGSGSVMDKENQKLKLVKENSGNFSLRACKRMDARTRTHANKSALINKINKFKNVAE